MRPRRFKDYTRTTRLESVLLGLVRTRAELRALKHHLVRSNTRNVYRADDVDRWIAGNPEVQGIDLFRTRRATATGEDLREEVVLLRWPG